jgi:hypothetical protein
VGHLLEKTLADKGHQRFQWLRGEALFRRTHRSRGGECRSAVRRHRELCSGRLAKNPVTLKMPGAFALHPTVMCLHLAAGAATGWS